MNIKFRMSVEEYRAYCMSFFTKFESKEKMHEMISSMSLEDFRQWIQDINTGYYGYYEPIKELVALIRGDYDPNKDYDSDKEDPLYEVSNHALFIKYRDIHNDVYQQYFNSLVSYSKKQEELKKFMEAKDLEELLNIEVDGKKFKALKVISVLWSGWESDQHAWLVEDNEELRLVASNHGSLFFTDKSFLESKISEYKHAIKETEDLLSIIK